MTIKFRVFASGSNGNSGILSTPDGALLIEAGISRKRLFELMNETKISREKIRGILISHSHTDHCRGLPIINETLNLPIISSKGTRDSFLRFQPYDTRWKIESEKVQVVDSEIPLEFGAFRIHALPTVHDVVGSTAFYIEYKDIGVTILTDTGTILPNHLDAINKSTITLLEMNHDIQALYRSRRTTWLKRRIRASHLDNHQTIGILHEIHEQKEALLFGHLSGECNSPNYVRGELVKWGEEMDEFPWNCFICQRNAPGPTLTLSGNDTLKASEEPLNLSTLKALKENDPNQTDLLSYFPE